MLRISDKEDQIEIKFHHGTCTPGEVYAATGTAPYKSRKCSWADVRINRHLVYSGMAVCCPTDNFCKAIGRKKSSSQSHPTSQERIAE